MSRSRIHSWNVSFERRLPYDISVDVAYVGTAKNGGFADIDANASDVPGGGVASQPVVATFAATELAAAVGTAHEIAVPLAAGRDQPAVQERAAC